MKSIFHPDRKHGTGTPGPRRTLVFLSRVLLLSTGLLTLLMPFTEYLWGWGRFLRGGHDFEFGFLGILLAIGLVIGIAHQIAASKLLLQMTGHWTKALPAVFWAGLACLFGAGAPCALDGAGHQARIVLSLPATPLRI